MRQLANLEPDPVIEEPVADNNHSEPPARRELTPRQLALWKVVQQAKAQDLSLRAISRQLGVHRNTVRKYAHSPTQPTNRPISRGTSRAHQPAISRSDRQIRFPFKLTESLDNDITSAQFRVAGDSVRQAMPPIGSVNQAGVLPGRAQRAVRLIIYTRAIGDAIELLARLKWPGSTADAAAVYETLEEMTRPGVSLSIDVSAQGISPRLGMEFHRPAEWHELDSAGWSGLFDRLEMMPAFRNSSLVRNSLCSRDSPIQPYQAHRI